VFIDQLIELQKDLISSQDTESRKYIEPASGGAASSSSNYYKEQKSKNPLKIWKVGEKCMARDTTNGQYYEATIESISNEGEAQVIFDAYQNRGQSNVKDLKEHKVRVEVFSSANSQKRSKAARPNHKEYLKKKKLKKQARLVELEEEREKEKNKWLNFTAKTNKKQINKQQSIFQSQPDGRVGIGTLKTNASDIPLPNNFQATRIDIHKQRKV
jgi:survival-of-motor-neuron-related-splicing factor 30